MRFLHSKFFLFYFSLFFMIASCNSSDEVAPDNTSNNSNNNNNLPPSSGNKMLDLVNEQRGKGCKCGATDMPAVPLLAWNVKLEQAAKNHSQDMFSNNFFSHTGSNGSNAGQRINLAGYQWSSWGENIANGQSTEEIVMQEWLKSEGHCKNIMNSKFKEMGAGRSGNLWTQVFATPK